MTPSQTIVRAANKTLATTDKTGRRLELRHLTALDTLRLFKAAGPILSQNEAWLSMAGLAISITEIDGVPVPQPTTEAQIENLVEKLGDLGLKAIADVVNEPQETSDRKPEVGN